MVMTKKHRMAELARVHSELLPCPFCGAKEVFIAQGVFVYVWCKNCESTGKRITLPSHAEKEWEPLQPVYQAAEAWNTRPCGHGELLEIHKIMLCPADVKEGQYANAAYTVKAVAELILAHKTT
jgi:hypothetical protein